MVEDVNPVLNRMNERKRVRETNLSDAQRTIVSQLVAEDFETEFQLVNVYGADRDSLTEIGKVLGTKDEWAYFPWYNPAKSNSASEKAVVDHVPSTRKASRRVREMITFDEYDIVTALSIEQLPECHGYFHLQR